MFSRTWVNLRPEFTLNVCRASPVTRTRGTISCHAAASGSPAISSNDGYPLTQHASAEHAAGKSPVKNAVSTTI